MYQGKFFPQPYWNEECKHMWHERERLYRQYKNTGLDAVKVQWKRTRDLPSKHSKDVNAKNFNNTWMVCVIMLLFLRYTTKYAN